MFIISTESLIRCMDYFRSIHNEELNIKIKYHKKHNDMFYPDILDENVEIFASSNPNIIRGDILLYNKNAKIYYNEIKEQYNCLWQLDEISIYDKTIDLYFVQFDGFISNIKMEEILKNANNLINIAKYSICIDLFCSIYNFSLHKNELKDVITYLNFMYKNVDKCIDIKNYILDIFSNHFKESIKDLIEYTIYDQFNKFDNFCTRDIKNLPKSFKAARIERDGSPKEILEVDDSYIYNWLYKCDSYRSVIFSQYNCYTNIANHLQMAEGELLMCRPRYQYFDFEVKRMLLLHSHIKTSFIAGDAGGYSFKIISGQNIFNVEGDEIIIADREADECFKSIKNSSKIIKETTNNNETIITAYTDIFYQPEPEFIIGDIDFMLINNENSKDQFIIMKNNIALKGGISKCI